MFDFGLLTLPLLAGAAAGAIFTAALFIGEDVVIDKFEVSHQLEWTGFSSIVATRQLTDELRELNSAAASELAGINVDQTDLQKGISAFEDYFDIKTLINGTRDLLGLIPYYVEGEMTESAGKVVLVARIYNVDENVPVHVVTAIGEPTNIPAILHEGALGILEHINPYIVVLYNRQAETAANQYDFTKTDEAVKHYLAATPLDEHYLAYGLMGRAYMIRAERDPNLTPEQRQAAYDKSVEYLHAALRQQSDFLYPLINLGLIHALRGDYELAERYFAKAVETNPNYLVTRRAWGDLLIKQDRPREAIIQYVAAVEIAPLNADLRDKLARLYVDVGMPDAARAQWEEAILINPTNTSYVDSLRALNGGKECPPGLEQTC